MRLVSFGTSTGVVHGCCQPGVLIFKTDGGVFLVILRRMVPGSPVSTRPQMLFIQMGCFKDEVERAMGVQRCWVARQVVD